TVVLTDGRNGEREDRTWKGNERRPCGEPGKGETEEGGGRWRRRRRLGRRHRSWKCACTKDAQIRPRTANPASRLQRRNRHSSFHCGLHSLPLRLPPSWVHLQTIAQHHDPNTM
ncbi:hypothetical protein HK104_001177, partial [Borealophlyctis nickersoniae]